MDYFLILKSQTLITPSAKPPYNLSASIAKAVQGTGFLFSLKKLINLMHFHKKKNNS